MNINKQYLNLTKENLDFAKTVIAIIPVPFDKTATWKKGANKGPNAIIKASPHLEFYDIEMDFEAYKHGIYTHTKKINVSSSEKMIKSVHKVVEYYLSKNILPVVLGGDHSVCIGAVEAVRETNKNLCVLQLDAHSDLRDEYNGSKYNHACVMARIKEITPIVQVGIRSMDISEKKNIDPGSIFYAKDIYNNNSWIDSVIKLLSDNVYITIDLDVFDPSIMPSTGTPEPGGLSWYQVIVLLKKVFEQKNVLGFDIVELCPDKNHSSDFLAAKLVYKMLTYYLFYRG